MSHDAFVPGGAAVPAKEAIGARTVLEASERELRVIDETEWGPLLLLARLPFGVVYVVFFVSLVRRLFGIEPVPPEPGALVTGALGVMLPLLYAAQIRLAERISIAFGPDGVTVERRRRPWWWDRDGWCNYADLSGLRVVQGAGAFSLELLRGRQVLVSFGHMSRADAEALAERLTNFMKQQGFAPGRTTATSRLEARSTAAVPALATLEVAAPRAPRSSGAPPPPVRRR